jgi:hypothetical protein
VPEERLDVGQVGSPLVKKSRGGRMPQGMGGNYRHPRSLAAELDAGIECLIAKWCAVSTGKHQLRSSNDDSLGLQPHAFDAFQEWEPCPKGNLIFLSCKSRNENVREQL